MILGFQNSCFEVCENYILDALDYGSLGFGLIEPHRHTTARPIPNFRCTVVLILNRHGIMSEEYYKLHLSLDEFRMGWKAVWQCRKHGGWTIRWLIASRSIGRNCRSSTDIDIAVVYSGSSWHSLYGGMFTSAEGDVAVHFTLVLGTRLPTLVPAIGVVHFVSNEPVDTWSSKTNNSMLG